MNILIVDDSRTLRYVLIKTLHELGYKNVSAAAGVDEARKALAKHSFDVVLCDWHMPVETGLDLVKYMRATPEFAKIPFMMLSTETDKSRIIEAVKTGIQSFMFKPVQKAVLAQKLNDIALKK
jgi:Response regulator containing CheY-like receiver, AAA-type ATPase, and DNA-binding domains